MFLLLNEERKVCFVLENAYYAKIEGEGEEAHWAECDYQAIIKEQELINNKAENDTTFRGVCIYDSLRRCSYPANYTIADVGMLPDTLDMKRLNRNGYFYIDGNFVEDESYIPEIPEIERIAALEDMVNMLLLGGQL